MALKAELYRADDGWRFRIKAENGEIIAQSEAYTRLSDAESTALRLATEVKVVKEEE